MSWLDRLPWKKSRQGSKYASMLNGFSPIFSQFGQDIYASDVVVQAMDCIVSEMMKLNPRHVRCVGNDIVPQTRSSIQAVLDNPNPLMTKNEFIGKIMWSLLFNCNAFAIPVYCTWVDEKTKAEQRIYKSLWPVQPTQVDFIEDASTTLYIKMRFANNHETTLPYSDVIHVRRNYSVNEFMGGNELGQADNKALLKTLELNDTLLNGVGKAMNSSFAINGVVKYNTLMDAGKTEAALKELEAKLLNSESGFLPLDLKAEFMPIKKEIKLVDAETLKFIDEKILRNYGVSLPILTGDYAKEQYEAFYQKTLEKYIIAISQAFTKCLFTERQKSYGNQIKFYPKDLLFLSVDQTIQMIKELGPTGALFENEKRVAFGMEPLPELAGKRYMSLNYVDVEIANEYQLDKKFKKKEEDVEGEEENEE